MQSRLNPYLHFNGNARQAMEFYQGVFGGSLQISTFKEFGVSPDPSEDDKVMHAQLEAPNGITFMGSDTPKHMEFHPGATVTMSLSGDDAAALSGYFEKLAAGGTVDTPLMQSPWGDTFGMLTDQFGIEWMVNIAGSHA
jgi:PhnB protein